MFEEETPDEDHQFKSPFGSSFRTFDATDYSCIATIDIKRMIYDLAVDPGDNFIAVIENGMSRGDMANMSPSDNVCRLYEVGRSKEPDEEADEEEEDEDDAEADEDDDDDDDDSEIMDGTDDFMRLSSTDEEGSSGTEDGGADDDQADHDEDFEDEDEDQWETDYSGSSLTSSDDSSS